MFIAATSLNPKEISKQGCDLFSSHFTDNKTGSVIRGFPQLQAAIIGRLKLLVFTLSSLLRRKEIRCYFAMGMVGNQGFRGDTQGSEMEREALTERL